MKKSDRPVARPAEQQPTDPVPAGTPHLLSKFEQIEQEFTEKIREQEARGKRSAVEMAESAQSIGQLLVDAKAKLRKGRFGKWAETTLNYTPQHISWLMRVARKWEELRPQIEDGSSVSQAMRTLTALRVGVVKPPIAEADPLTLLHRVIGGAQHFADQFTEEQVIEAAKRQGGTDLAELVDAAEWQRDYWKEISERLRLLTAKRVSARQSYQEGKLLPASVAH